MIVSSIKSMATKGHVSVAHPGFPMFRFATIGIGFSRRNHFALLNKKASQRLAMLLGPTKWAHLGSNQGPLDYESSALTS